MSKVRKSPAMLELEARHGKPVEQIVAEAVTAQGSVPLAAEALGLNLNTLYGWIRFLRIELRTTASAS